MNKNIVIRQIQVKDVMTKSNAPIDRVKKFFTKNVT